MTIKTIPRLSLQFNSTELVLFDASGSPLLRDKDEDVESSTTRLGGQLVVSMVGLKQKPKEIELRFVAGVVSKYDEPYEEVSLHETRVDAVVGVLTRH